ncbi:MAG: hypothetical protein IOC87_00450 [Rhodobacter sp.]|nr:hypothetical protein [Rhodobacter sp.]MCA3533770.1 hypothetical protein [Rhodobacter sp.]
MTGGHPLQPEDRADHSRPGGGDCLAALKANRPETLRDVKDCLTDANALIADTHETADTRPPTQAMAGSGSGPRP